MKNFVGFWKNTRKNRSLMVMALPALILMIMFSYVPMYGVVLAFKKFNYMQGFNSPWCLFYQVTKNSGALYSTTQGLYEAAELDGANAWQRMIHITIPMLVPQSLSDFMHPGNLY